MVSTPAVDAPHRSAEAVGSRLLLDDPVTALRSSPVVGEPQQVERPGALRVTLPARRQRRWTERNEARLVGMDRQAVLAKPLGQDFHHALRIVMIAKANDE